MLRCLLLSFLAGVSVGIPIDNALEGEPEVQCGPNSIQFSFSTTNNFEGVVYAKDNHDVEGCSSFGDAAVRGGNIEMIFDSCNLEPRGVFVRATVVVQFHRLVTTKVDRAFHLECFYMEADKTVDAEIEVSMLTTELRTYLVPMPVCRYDILDGGPTGAPVRFVTIGQPIYHQWTCDTETVDTFCMEVHSCTVDDGTGNPETSIELVDINGCSVDRNLLDNLEYPTDLIGGMEAHVFKYADRPQLYFNCQIRIGVKEPGLQCPEWREDGQGPCPEAQFTFGRKRRSVSAAGERSREGRDIDVAPLRPLFVADVELTENDLANSLHDSNKPRNSGTQFCASQEIPGPPSQDTSCSAQIQGRERAEMETGMVGGVMTAVVLLGITSIILGILLAFRGRSKFDSREYA